MVTPLGMSKNFDMIVLETVFKIDKEVLNIIRKSHEKATNILKR